MTTTYQPRNFSNDQIAKLKAFLTEGGNVLSDIDDLKAGLSDTTQAIAKEMEIKPAILTKAIKTAMKNNFGEAEEDLNVLDDILTSVGRK